MEYAVAAPVRFRLTGSRFAAAAPVVLACLLLTVAAAGFTGVAWWVLRPSPVTLLAMVAFGALALAPAARTIARWRTAPALYAGGTSLTLVHPDLAAPLVVPVADVGFVGWSAEPATTLWPSARFPVVAEDGRPLGHLWEAGRGSALTFFDTSPAHRPTVAVLFRVPRDLPVRRWSVMRRPLAEYPVHDSFGLLLSIRDVAAVRAAVDRAGLPHGPALPRARAVGVPLHEPR